MKPQRYRIDCTGCGWHGYRINAFDCECYDYPCRPTSPGMGCPNGANLYVVCPRCRNFRAEIWRNIPRAKHDVGRILVRLAWTRAEVRAFHKARARKGS